MQSKINLGTIDILNRTYKKTVKFSQAVLWKDRQLSVPIPIIERIRKENITSMEFTDYGKGEIWVFNAKDVLNQGAPKKVGQEEQWYFPIGICKVEKLIYK